MPRVANPIIKIRMNSSGKFLLPRLKTVINTSEKKDTNIYRNWSKIAYGQIGYKTTAIGKDTFEKNLQE